MTKRIRDRKKMNGYARSWRTKYPALAKDAYYRYKYGITYKDYLARVAAQNGLCAICRKPGTAKRRLAVDHDHKTGKVRGLLCVNCNAALGGFGESPALLAKAIEYVNSAALPSNK